MFHTIKSIIFAIVFTGLSSPLTISNPAIIPVVFILIIIAVTLDDIRLYWQAKEKRDIMLYKAQFNKK